MLELGVLEHGLNYQVNVGEICVVSSGLNPGQQCLGLFLSGATALECLGLQALGVGLAALGVFDGDVLEHNLHASLGAHVGDSGAHHARAHHGNLGELPLGVVGAISLLGARATALSVVEVEEEGLHHILRLGAGDQLGEVAGLHAQCSIDIHLGAFDSGLHGQARRLHRDPELLGQVCRERRQVHSELRGLRIAAGDLEALDIPGLGGGSCLGGEPLAGSIQQLLRGDNLVDQAGGQSLCRVHLGAGEDDLHQRSLDANHADHAGDAATAGQQTEGDLRQANLGTAGVSGDAVVRSQGDFQAAAEGSTVDGGNHGHRQLLDAAQGGLHVLDHGEHSLSVSLSGLGHLLDVATSEEGLLGGGDDDALNRAVLAVADFFFQAGHGGANVVLESLVHGVDRGIGVIHGDGDDALGVLLPPEHVVVAHFSVSAFRCQYLRVFPVGYTRSTMVATPIPPATHRAIRP